MEDSNNIPISQDEFQSIYFVMMRYNRRFGYIGKVPGDTMVRFYDSPIADHTAFITLDEIKEAIMQ